jgi:alanine dehydrogenase
VVCAYVGAGYSVCIEKSAGLGSAITDDGYKAAGAVILNTAAEVWKSANMLVKVKEPLESGYELMRENQLVYAHILPFCGK